jgi:hypothetical protein
MDILQKSPLHSNDKHEPLPAMSVHSSMEALEAIFSHWSGMKWYSRSLVACRRAHAIFNSEYCSSKTVFLSHINYTNFEAVDVSEVGRLKD